MIMIMLGSPKVSSKWMPVSVTNYPIDICLFLLIFPLVDKLMHVAEVAEVAEAAAAAANGVHNLGLGMAEYSERIMAIK